MSGQRAYSEEIMRFLGRLKTVTSSDSPATWSGRWCDFFEIENADSQRMLPPYQPQVTNRSNWARISPHLEVTDLSNVYKVCKLDTKVVNKRFLQRCRSLRNLCLLGVDSGCFDWAVQEKKEQEGKVGQDWKVDSPAQSGSGGVISLNSAFWN